MASVLCMVAILGDDALPLLSYVSGAAMNGCGLRIWCHHESRIVILRRLRRFPQLIISSLRFFSVTAVVANGDVSQR